MPVIPKPTLTTGADNASGTHRPGHYIRSVCAARHWLRAEGDVAGGGWSARIYQLGGGRSAPAGSAPHRPARIASGERAALCVAQAAAPAELRGTCLPP